MEQNLVKQQTTSLAFVENATQSIENMMKYAEVLLESGLCPSHFYEKDVKGKPDLTKGKPAAVVMVLQHGMEIGLSPMQSLQQVVPVNGLISIKGDGAKSLIFRSGLLEPGSWKEEESGTINNEDYTYSITAQRKDNGLKMTSTFSVAHAKRSGLWIDKSKIQGQDGWKYKLSAWYRYPTRMIKYRALGFLARDLFGDVLQGMYTAEEAQDMPQDQTTIIETPQGDKITIPDKDFNKERSQNLTSKATEKIDKANKSSEASHIVTEESNDKMDQDTAQEEKVSTIENNEEIKVYSKEELDKMNTTELLDIVDGNDEMNSAKDTLEPVRNTAPKLKRIIELYQEGKLSEAVEKFKEQKAKIQTKEESEAPEEKEEAEQGELQMEAMDNGEEEEEQEIPEGRDDDIQPNKEFEAEKKSVDQSPSEQLTSNKHGIEVPELPDTEENRRKAEVAVKIFNEMIKIGIDNKAFEDIVKNKLTGLNKYSNKELFCFTATAHEINLLLDSV